MCYHCRSGWRTYSRGDASRIRDAQDEIGGVVIDDPFFRIFADVARREGIEIAETTYRGNIPDEKLDAFIAEYHRLVTTIQTGKPGIIAGTGIVTWYPGPLPPDDRNWTAFARYLSEDLHWKPEPVEQVNQSSTKAIAYTPEPHLQNWTSKGLVVGYVQSGKTTNFTAVISKAADVRYRLVIVLSGIHNGLRRQTQERLVTQLQAHNPKAWIELTSLDDDFRKPTMSLASLLHRSGEGTALAVVKKNRWPLTRLSNWIQQAADQNALQDLRVLIIDDEADQATVATKKINPLIIAIIQKLPRCTYIGYTATPFANVLIDPAAGNLYPSDFILNLPPPKPDSGYFGAEQVFGRDAVEGDEASGADLDGYDMVRIIDDTELPSLRPLKRKDIPDFQPAVTASLKNAIRWFWLSTAARRARSDFGHSSMLVHTHQNTVVHDRFKGPLVDFRDMALDHIRRRNPDAIDQFRQLWISESAKVPASLFPGLQALTFDELVEHLEGVLAATKIVVDNSNSADRLDYSGDPQVAIAVGGNTLSRGLTLEGLVVSFFVRSSTAYDTLLQMARWFGYRKNYQDLPRVWMTDTLKKWFRHLATVEREIRLDIDRYEQQGYTPLQLGVRIRTHPKLAVTAKMGAWKPVAASFSDRRVQTRYFHEDDALWLENNRIAADELVRDARADGSQPEPDDDRRAVLLRHVRADRVLRFLKAYRVHEDSPDINGALLSAYIEKELQLGRLNDWTVAVMGPQASSASKNSITLGGIRVERVTRAALKDTPACRADIKTLMSKEHRVVDLEIAPGAARQRPENELVLMRNADPMHSDEGLLLLYPIDPQSIPAPDNEDSRRPLNAPGEVIGLATVFPESSGSKDDFVSVDLSGVDVDLSPAAEDIDESDDADINAVLDQE